MILKLDKEHADYPRKLAELRKIAAELRGEPRRSVICFKTFAEFSDYNGIFHHKPTRQRVDDETRNRQ